MSGAGAALPSVRASRAVDPRVYELYASLCAPPVLAATHRALGSKIKMPVHDLSCPRTSGARSRLPGLCGPPDPIPTRRRTARSFRPISFGAGQASRTHVNCDARRHLHAKIRSAHDQEGPCTYCKTTSTNPGLRSGFNTVNPDSAKQARIASRDAIDAPQRRRSRHARSARQPRLGTAK